MKNMLLVMMLAAAPAAAQEFASEAPAVGVILARTRALQASSSAARATAKLLHDIEKTKEKIRTYGDDPTRAGIYNAELSLLYLKLALQDARAAAEPSVNAELWKARRAVLDETDPERKARGRKELDRGIDAVLDASGKDLEGRSKPLPPLAYDPREIRVEIEGKVIRVYHKELPLATLRAGGALTGRHHMVMLAGFLEASRRRAIELGRKVSVDDKAVALYNETGFLDRMTLEQPQRFGAILTVSDEPAFP